MAQRRNHRLLVDAFRKSLAGWLGRASEVLDLSTLGVCEAAIARRQRPVRDALSVAPAEREGLDALRAVEAAGWNARGARIRARVSTETSKWLEADYIGWKESLAARIGARWVIETAERPPGRPEVWSVG